MTVGTAVAVGNSDTSVLTENRYRRYALFINDSDTDIYLMIGAAAVLNTGIRIAANGGAYEMADVYHNLDTRKVQAIASAGSKNLLVTEYP